LKKREGKGIWQNLYEFPSVESEIPLEFEDLMKHKDFQAFFPNEISKDSQMSSPIDNTAVFSLVIKNYKHVLTHRILYADFYDVWVKNKREMEKLKKFTKIKKDEIGDYPIHRLMERFFEEYAKNN
jgi:A/G-specific adenine glycosylase